MTINITTTEIHHTATAETATDMATMNNGKAAVVKMATAINVITTTGMDGMVTTGADGTVITEMDGIVTAGMDGTATVAGASTGITAILERP